MRIKRIMLLYLFVVAAVTAANPTVSLSNLPKEEVISQYIINLSNDIYGSIERPVDSMLSGSRGELRLSLFLSPWGELKDAKVSESSGSKELDNICLKAVWVYDRYQPFPEELGDEDRWIDVPIIFEKTKPWFPESGAKSVKEDMPQPEFFVGVGIDDAVDIAMENDMASRIAEEEISLSRLKIREARRGLYPAASLNIMETTGKTTAYTQDFTDKEYKMKFEYPLYYGWRLKYAVEQAISNMKASTYNYDKVQQDLRMEVEIAFYSYLATKANVKLQEALLKDVKGVFEGAKKRFDLELSTKAEFLQVESQMKQISYQVLSSENDMEIAKLVLTQAMNVKDIEGLVDVDTDLESLDMLMPVDIDISLEDCVELAYRNRPDLKIKEHMLDFNDYERKIALSKDQFKVDLTGTYGKSGGAYEFEPLNMDKDWYVGLKVSKPLGGNTLAASYTKEETSQKHGQSSRTESVSKSLELGILDNLQSFSEKKSASIALKKAMQELDAAKDAIFKEVKESYLNYKKGLIQAKTNFNKIRHKEEELKIAKARAGLNEIPSSELLKAHMELTDEKSYYIEALGSLYQSLARLNKASGYTLFLDNDTFRIANARPMFKAKP
ncbi:MAG: TolC family protein [Candidatus Omnitrophica bacterium]|nr:TolC family protein [Candidatus Omnitrophota bacterium]MBU4590695.1 TolC family protein [Candidatus Omnitrophota bacterium]